jgi:hypothetical protein
MIQSKVSAALLSRGIERLQTTRLITAFIASAAVFYAVSAASQSAVQASRSYVAVVRPLFFGKEERFVLDGLGTLNPYAKAEDGSRFDLKPLYNEDEKMVLQFVAGSGGTMTFYVDLRARRFALVEMSFVFPGGGQLEPTVKHGILEAQ